MRVRIVVGALIGLAGAADVDSAPEDAILQSEFLFQEAPFASCHASTLAEIPDGTLVAAWFGGEEEGHPSVGIWVSRRGSDGWTPPVEVADGVQFSRQDGSIQRYPCWNPVLFQVSEGPLLLFFKVGPSPREWWGMLASSDDGGLTWGTPVRLPEGILGPIKNKPLLMGSDWLVCGSSTEDSGWRVHLEVTSDWGRSWIRVGPLNDGREIAAIQPTILRHSSGRLQLLARDRRSQGRIWSSWSDDRGLSWTALEPLDLPNPNSGLDAVTLKDGRHLLVYNHSLRDRGTPRDREVLNVAVSEDGIAWKAALVLEQETEQEFSYPAAILSSAGLVHVLYTWKRLNIRHVVIDPVQLRGIDMPKGRWPAFR